jgi:hypothetical protein
VYKARAVDLQLSNEHFQKFWLWSFWLGKFNLKLMWFFYVLWSAWLKLNAEVMASCHIVRWGRGCGVIFTVLQSHTLR